MSDLLEKYQGPIATTVFSTFTAWVFHKAASISYCPIRLTSLSPYITIPHLAGVLTIGTLFSNYIEGKSLSRSFVAAFTSYSAAALAYDPLNHFLSVMNPYPCAITSFYFSWLACSSSILGVATAQVLINEKLFQEQKTTTPNDLDYVRGC